MWLQRFPRRQLLPRLGLEFQLLHLPRVSPRAGSPMRLDLVQWKRADRRCGVNCRGCWSALATFSRVRESATVDAAYIYDVIGFRVCTGAR
jgi:hypothetical protein